LSAYVANVKVKIPQSGSEAFVEPSQAERDAFLGSMRDLLGGNSASAMSGLDAINYDLNYLNDEFFSKSYLVASERLTGSKNQGTYIVDLTYARNLLIEVPHPLYDVNTPEEGTAIFQRVGARALFIAGTHRCANPSTPSGCSGNTSACGGLQPYRISDTPHFNRNFMYAAHEASLSLMEPPIAFNVHGNSSAVPDVELSDGTKDPASETSLVNRLRAALAARLVSVASCNWPPDDPASLTLCGTDNVQGRRSNGSAEACTTPAASATGRFLHLEQHRNIRDDPTLLIDAIKEVFTVP
jgi:hypothetical protein